MKIVNTLGPPPKGGGHMTGDHSDSDHADGDHADGDHGDQQHIRVQDSHRLDQHGDSDNDAGGDMAGLSSLLVVNVGNGGMIHNNS